LPLLLAIAVVIRLTSPGPALFVQLRAGKDGRPFRLYKFRTMHTAADEDAHRRFVRDFINGGGSFTAKEHGARKYGVTEDDRITRVGRVLRASCLDEVPQLWNVIRGEMSIVGPRPAVLYELPYYASRHRRRLSVTPGLTGLWQVGCRSATSFEEMVELDLYYIDHWSLFLDIAIVLKTVRVLLTGVGRY
jgi:lipopolysaccharide/colanic/teichoic acid biosynthesis glycosyltransferase